MRVQRIELIRVIRKANDHGLASATAQAGAILESDWLRERLAQALESAAQDLPRLEGTQITRQQAASSWLMDRADSIRRVSHE